MPELHVLIIAENPLARMGLAALLANHPEIVIVGQSGGAQVAAEAEASNPDVLIVDWNENSAPDLPAGYPLLALLKEQQQQSQQRNQSANVIAALGEIIKLGKAARNAPPPKETKRFSAGNPAFSVQVSEPRKFWGRSRQELMFGYLTLRAENKPISQEYVKVMVARTFDALQKNNDPVMTDLAVRSAMPSTRWPPSSSPPRGSACTMRCRWCTASSPTSS